MFAACFISCCIGLLTLSQEMLWIRLFGFANNSVPQAFAFVLTMYLLGIACGVMAGRVVCERYTNLWKCCGVILMAASLFDLTSPWAYALSSQTAYQLIVGGVLMILMAGFKASIFPMMHHLGVPSAGPTIGRSVSRVYFAYIAGATLGPFFTSGILLSAMTTQDCFAVCAELCFLVSLYCLRDEFKPVTWAVSSLVAIIILSFIVKQEHTQMLSYAAVERGTINKIVETRQGIIVSYKGIDNDDIVFNNNVYDGRTNFDPLINSNNINRLLVLAALNDKPENVLLIGLSVGSWLKVISSFPYVKSIDVTEANPGFLTIIKDYPALQAVLNDPRVHLHFTDGRRWLRMHPTKKYDLIVMNTSFSWRAYGAHLVSQEFLLMLKQRLNNNGVLAYNSFSSEHEFKTAQTVFSCVHMYENFIIAGDFDWRVKMHDALAIKKLATLHVDGKLIFPPGSDSLIKTFLNEMTSDFIDMDVTTPTGIVQIRPKVITDDNVLPEFKHGKELGTKLF